MEPLDKEQMEGLLIALGFIVIFLIWAFTGMSKWEFNRHYPREGDFKEPGGGRVCSVSYDDHMEKTYGSNKSTK